MNKPQNPTADNMLLKLYHSQDETVLWESTDSYLETAKSEASPEVCPEDITEQL